MILTIRRIAKQPYNLYMPDLHTYASNIQTYIYLFVQHKQRSHNYILLSGKMKITHAFQADGTHRSH